MIEVAIKGPLPQKTYAQITKLLTTAGEKARLEKRVFVDYPAGISLRGKNDTADIVLKRKDSEIVTTLARGEFSNAVALLASLGKTKGTVVERNFFTAKYGGAVFTLVDTGEDGLAYYEALIVVKDPTTAKEAEAKLALLAKKLKLPVWSQSDMFGFMKRLDEKVNYEYDYGVQGADYFKNKFGI